MKRLFFFLSLFQQAICQYGFFFIIPVQPSPFQADFAKYKTSCLLNNPCIVLNNAFVFFRHCCILIRQMPHGVAMSFKTT